MDHAPNRDNNTNNNNNNQQTTIGVERMCMRAFYPFVFRHNNEGRG